LEEKSSAKTRRDSFEKIPDLPKRHWHLSNGSSDPSRSRITAQNKDSD
jgi:hypothetical protein